MNIWLKDRTPVISIGDYHLVQDMFPVSQGHLLIIPKDTRPYPKWNDWNDIGLLLEYAQDWIKKKHSPDGFNVGFNLGEASGQTVSVWHMHIIPRYKGDVPNPRGGVRNVIPSKGDYTNGN